MGKLIISQIGGSGGDLDMITATSSDVIKDKIIVGKDGEPIVGSLQLVGTASANHVLSGKTFYNTNAQAIQTGSLAIQSAISFSAAAQSSTTIRISWKNPSKGPWTGVKIRVSTSGYPGVSGGTLKYTGYGSSAVAGGTSYVDITGLSFGTTYYFTCYSYVTGLGDSTTGYNVNAKTNNLVLWDGTSALNGASTTENGYELQYSFTKGSLNNKTLCFVIKKYNLGYVGLSNIYAESGSGSMQHGYTYIGLNAAGTKVLAYETGNDAISEWIAGNEYTIAYNLTKAYSTVNRFQLSMRTDTGGRLKFSSYISNIYIK